MKKILHTIEKILGIYRWHPTIALRYLPIVAKIKEKRLESESIIEIGSGGLGIAPYIKQKVVGIDLNFSNPIHPLLTPVKADALNLPFSNNSFTTVISSDMLEHIPQNKRAQAIKEMLRIAKKLVCIGVPCGIQAYNQDKQLAEKYKLTHNQEFDFFSEHVNLGLPDVDWIKKTINETARQLDKEIFIEHKATLNLGLRYFLMSGWMSKNWFANIVFRKLLLFFIPWLLTQNQKPTYREIFFVEIH